MRKFLVNVNGTSYEVEVEEVKGDFKPSAAPAPAAATAAPAKQTTPGTAETIAAPMPGTIVGVNVKVGDSFKRGQVLLVLEAMKMENEILAPRDGRVVALNTSRGATVNSGDILIAFE